MQAVIRFVLPLLAAALLLPSLCPARDYSKITAMVPHDVFMDYLRFLDGRNPLEITSFSGAMARRDVVELVLLQQALHAGGLDAPVEFVMGPSYGRILEQVRDGRVDLTATTAWLSDLQGMEKSVRASRALVKNGRFEAGFYTARENRTALAVDSVEKLKALVVLSSQDWKPDWKALKALNLPRLEHVAKWSLMVKMVICKRAGCVLAPFQSTPDLSLETQWGTLVPIPGIKIGLVGSRHFFVYTGSERGKRMYAALNKGLDLMIRQGIVDRAYHDCGFYNQHTENWKRLN